MRSCFFSSAHLNPQVDLTADVHLSTLLELCHAPLVLFLPLTSLRTALGAILLRQLPPLPRVPFPSFPSPSALVSFALLRGPRATCARWGA